MCGLVWQKGYKNNGVHDVFFVVMGGVVRGRVIGIHVAKLRNNEIRGKDSNSLVDM